MKKILSTLAIALLLGGCAAFQAATTANKPIGAQTTAELQDAAYKAKLGFQAALSLAVLYIETPRCGRPTSPTICSSQAVVNVMRSAIVTADTGTQEAENAARALTPDTTVLRVLVTAAEKSVTVLQTLTPAKK